MNGRLYKAPPQPGAALTGVCPETGGVEFAHVELNPDDGEHHDSKEEQEADL